MLDFLRPDHCPAPDWNLVIEAVADTQVATGRPIAIVSSLPDTFPEATARAVLARGIAPLCGLSDALEAIASAAQIGRHMLLLPVLLPGPDGPTRVLSEAQSKTALSHYGLLVPASFSAAFMEQAAERAHCLKPPLALKGIGIAHKSDVGAVRLNLMAENIEHAGRAMPASMFLVEEMIDGPAIELLIGVIRDPAHGFVLTLRAGGTLTEIMGETIHLLLHCTARQITEALHRLRIAPRLAGYRGARAASIPAIASAVLAVQDYVCAHAADLFEVEINPLLCTPTRAVAADALIRLRKTP